MPNRWMSKEAAREKSAGTKGSFTRIADRHYIIERGRICFGGTMAELDARPDVRDAHLSL